MIRNTCVVLLVLFAGCGGGLLASQPVSMQYLGENGGCGHDLPADPGGGSGGSVRAAHDPSETLGEQRTLVTLVNYQNDLSTPFTPAEVEDVILNTGNPGSAASYVAEASYGRAWLAGDVLGWFTMPWDDSVCHLHASYQHQYLVDELDPLIDFSRYDRWVVVIPSNPNCGFVGYSSLGKQSFDTDEGTVQMSRFFLNGFSANYDAVAIHEFGHSLAGLQHSRDYECGAEVIGDECSANGPGSLSARYDVLGDTFLIGHYSAPNKDVMGWLGQDVLEVAPPGGTYTLLPYESQTPGLKVLRIPVSYIADNFSTVRNYYVSYRKPLGFDATFAELATDGALLEIDSKAIVDDGVRRSWLLDASPHADADATAQENDSQDVLLGVGQTYTDATKGISISVLGVNGGALEVSVAVTKYCGNGIVEPLIGETCDGADLAGATCGSLGRADGPLGCSASCTLDESLCGIDRCGAGHAFNPDQTCTATILADATDHGVWMSDADYPTVRSSAWGRGIFEETWLSVLNSQNLTPWNWIHRVALPFDTSAMPTGAVVNSADLLLKVVLAGGIENTHPASSDTLVMVHPTPAAPPDITRLEFDQFGTLDNPQEGASRIDVSDAAWQYGQIVDWPLDATGMGWVDPGGWTMLGIRTGFDVDNVFFTGEYHRFHVQFSSSDSPLYGPRLVVNYDAASPPAAGPAGAVPDGGTRPGTPLTLDRLPSGDLQLDWGTSCNGADGDYAVYEGTLGDFSSHLPRACSTSGATSASVTPAAGATYYLVVPRTADHEGSYGLTSQGVERPAAASACVPRQPAACAG